MLAALWPVLAETLGIDPDTQFLAADFKFRFLGQQNRNDIVTVHLPLVRLAAWEQAAWKSGRPFGRLRRLR